MFYQLAEANNEGKIPNSTSGLVVKDGIDEDKAGKIYYRQLQYYATKDTTFSQARSIKIRPSCPTDSHRHGELDHPDPPPLGRCATSDHLVNGSWGSSKPLNPR